MFRCLFGADLRSLAALRIGAALILILDLFQRVADLEAHYTDFGLVSRSLVIENLTSRWFLSLHFLSGAWQVQLLMFLAAGIFAAMLLVGYKTRLATIASWILLISLVNRNPYIAQGGDMLLRLVLFWSIFLPLGARFSVDYAWSRDSGDGANNIFSAGTVAYSAQIIVMYCFSVLAKTGNEWWAEGSAVYYALNIDYLVTPVGHLASRLPFTTLQFATWTVLAFEALGPVLLLCPWRNGTIRTFAIFGFIAMHCIFLVTMFIGIFPLVGIVSVLFFLPTSFWDGLLRPRLRSSQQLLKVYHGAKCIPCMKLLKLVKIFLLGNAIQLLPAKAGASEEIPELNNEFWIVVDGSGRQLRGYEGLLTLASSSYFLRWLIPVLRMPWVRHWGNRSLINLGEHRAFLCRLSGGRSESDSSQRCLSIPINVLAGFLTVYLIAWNLANLPNSPVKLSERSRALGDVLGVYQSWELFAPFPAKDDGWYVIPATLRDGRQVDLSRGGADIDWQKPESIALSIKNNRWRKFLETLRRKSFLASAYSAYLCKDWNRRHSPSEAVMNLEIVYMLEWTQPKSTSIEPKPMRLLKHTCER